MPMRRVRASSKRPTRVRCLWTKSAICPYRFRPSCSTCFRVATSVGWGAADRFRSTLRLISATNKDLPLLIREGQFREDLFYRINTIHLEIPPLRERGDDILLFIDAFLRKYAAKIPEEAVAYARTDD